MRSMRSIRGVHSLGTVTKARHGPCPASHNVLLKSKYVADSVSKVCRDRDRDPDWESDDLKMCLNKGYCGPAVCLMTC